MMRSLVPSARGATVSAWRENSRAPGARARQPVELLAPIYGWFTEGFDTADLQDAKALLEALA